MKLYFCSSKCRQLLQGGFAQLAAVLRKFFITCTQIKGLRIFGRERTTTARRLCQGTPSSKQLHCRAPQPQQHGNIQNYSLDTHSSLGKKLSTFAFLLCTSLWVHQRACHSFPSGFSARCTPVPQWFWNTRSTAIRFAQWQNWLQKTSIWFLSWIPSFLFKILLLGQRVSETKSFIFY